MKNSKLSQEVPAPVVQDVEGFRIVRDDLLPGGTKIRALYPILKAAAGRVWAPKEFVYASPAQGYAQVAAAIACKALGKRMTIFTAKRDKPHRLTLRAMEEGAQVVMVPCGYLTVVTARAREYAAKNEAEVLPFGLDCEAALEGIANAARFIPYPPPKEVWTVAGSGVLTRSLQRAWPKASFHAVIVGKKDSDIGFAVPHVCPLPFERDATLLPPFPSASNYDAKAWKYMKESASPGALFWNVGA